MVVASEPSLLASMTVTVDGTGVSATVSPVSSTNTFVFEPPISVSPNQSIAFTLSAITAAQNSRRDDAILYASMVGRIGGNGGGSTGTGLLMLAGIIMLPFGLKTRRRSAIAACLFLLLMLGAAGCTDSSNGGGPSIQHTNVSAEGKLTSPLTLSDITESGGGTSAQQITAVGFGSE